MKVKNIRLLAGGCAIVSGIVLSNFYKKAKETNQQVDPYSIESVQQVDFVSQMRTYQARYLEVLEFESRNYMMSSSVATMQPKDATTFIEETIRYFKEQGIETKAEDYLPYSEVVGIEKESILGDASYEMSYSYASNNQVSRSQIRFVWNIGEDRYERLVTNMKVGEDSPIIIEQETKEHNGVKVEWENPTVAQLHHLTEIVNCTEETVFSREQVLEILDQLNNETEVAKTLQK